MSGDLAARLAAGRIVVRNDDYDDEGNRCFILDRPWSVLVAGKAPIYLRRFDAAVTVASGLAADARRAVLAG